MEKTSSDLFKSSLDKAFLQPNIKLNQSTMMDNLKYKQSFQEEKLEGGRSDNKTFDDLVKKYSRKKDKEKVYLSLKSQLNKGIKHEFEHTKSKTEAKEIAMDHLWDDPNYYTKLKKIEGKEATGTGSSGAYSGPLFGDQSSFIKKSFSETPKLKKESVEDVEKVEATEATGSGSVGGYETPAMWAKSTKKKDWGPSRKTQYKGGSFVKVKKKCTKFPYCNQGDINALKLTKNESVKEAIDSVSEKYGISKKIIINILEQEYFEMNKRTN